MRTWRRGCPDFFDGDERLAALSATRASEYPQRHLADCVGIMQADAFAGYNALYDARRRPGQIIEAACWSHSRRHFFNLAKLAKTPIAAEAVRRIDELFEIERTINGKMPTERLTVRREQSKPLVELLETWLREQSALVSAKSDIAKAINLNCWPAFTRFLDDGRICLSNDAAEVHYFLRHGGVRYGTSSTRLRHND